MSTFSSSVYPGASITSSRSLSGAGVPARSLAVAMNRTHSQRLRTLAAVPLEVELRDPPTIPMFQRIAAQAAEMRRRGRPFRAVTEHFGGDDTRPRRPFSGFTASCDVVRCLDPIGLNGWRAAPSSISCGVSAFASRSSPVSVGSRLSSTGSAAVVVPVHGHARARHHQRHGPEGSAAAARASTTRRRRRRRRRPACTGRPGGSEAPALCRGAGPRRR